MDEEDILRLIAELRTQLLKNGFEWALEQAEVSVPPEASPVRLAYALVTAAEAATVGLADVEGAALAGLNVEDLQFKLDEGSVHDGEETFTRVADGSDQRLMELRGPQRRAVIAELQTLSPVFRQLKEELNGLL
ncbi:hypothetical protein [Sphingobium yanoikuyae]|uniref:hypothetical protein n=1 Tax=Sphingobium yanoikuyae TaxID=13690 RepID=UPI0028A7487C|nr:hypothetical protein [Sphingobium yanoikuyae]